MGFKKKRGRLEGVTKNALLKEEDKSQQKKRRARPPISESNFWRPPFIYAYSQHNQAFCRQTKSLCVCVCVCVCELTLKQY